MNRPYGVITKAGNCRIYGGERGATLAVARGDGGEILRCNQNDRTGGAGVTAGGAESRPYGSM